MRTRTHINIQERKCINQLYWIWVSREQSALGHFSWSQLTRKRLFSPVYFRAIENIHIWLLTRTTIHNHGNIVEGVGKESGGFIDCLFRFCFRVAVVRYLRLCVDKFSNVEYKQNGKIEQKWNRKWNLEKSIKLDGMLSTQQRRNERGGWSD